ncbi:MAG: hypothetical protein HYR56_12405 [Acidobacteria bacterium]|nr:hypothetical protein [Acidobacteriota bacterium]MBI3425232.1 hypothetical protein [Acidobacteriota bacterium]
MKSQTKITSLADFQAVPEPTPSLLHRALHFLHLQPTLAVALTGLAVATLSLGTWVGALFLENKVLKTRLGLQQAQAKAEDADELKTRIAETQEKMAQLKAKIEAQETGEMLDNRADLIAENARLLQELNQLSKPQLGAPLVELDSAAVKQADVSAANPKKDAFSTVDVPPNLALFTVVLRQAQDKGYQSYFVELTDANGKRIAWSEQLKKASGLNIPLTFAKRSHAPGRYQLKLYGMNGKKKEFVDHYDMQVNYLPEPAKPKAKKK